MEEAIIDDVLRDRDRNAQKGDHGRVLVVAGSHAYTNTPAICGLAALRTGADLCTLIAPDRAADRSANFALNFVTEPLFGDYLDLEHLSTIKDHAAEADAVVIGPGLGRTTATKETVKRFLSQAETPTVVDADALHLVAENKSVVDYNMVLTPHAAEFEAITGSHPPDDLDDRMELVKNYAKSLGCTILLKGPTDVIADEDRVTTNDTGTPYMTRGGTGDILAGITGALLAHRNQHFEAAVAAAHLNGLAGENTVETHGGGFLLEEMLDELGVLI